MADVYLQNVTISHPSLWIRIQGLTFGDCIVAQNMPIAYDTVRAISSHFFC
jgi:hypothetical protein